MNTNNLSNGIIDLYREASKKYPLLKYSWVFIATICILALTAYYNLNKQDVFLYAIAVILISFLGFVFSYFQKLKDRFVRLFLRIICASITITLSAAILAIGSFIIFKTPDLSHFLSPSSNSAENSQNRNDDTTQNRTVITQYNDSGINVGRDLNINTKGDSSKTNKMVNNTTITQTNNKGINVGRDYNKNGKQ